MCAMLTEKLAQKLFGSTSMAVGQVVKLFGLRFTVIGTFKERTGTFGILRNRRRNGADPDYCDQAFHSSGAY